MTQTVWLLEYESKIRMFFYFSVLFSMAIWEHYSSALSIKTSKPLRWFNNISLAWLSALSVKWLLPSTALGIAVVMSEQQIGLLSHTPIWVNLTLSLLILDCLIYWQHRIFHRIPLLWRLHATHHLDPEVDASTGARFHPIEIVLSMLVKIGAITLLGCSPLGILIFEILLNSSSTFNHSNIRLPKMLNTALNKFLITPEVHRIHHSTNPVETHSNFGFCLSIWDKLFQTYRNKSITKEVDMSLGLPNLSAELKNNSLLSLITFPFRYKT